MTKKRLISNIVMSVLIALSIGAVFILYFVGIQDGKLFNENLMTINEEFFKAFTTFDNLMVFLPVVGVAAFWLVMAIIWLIIDIIRKRAIVALYLVFLLCGCYLCGFYYIRLFIITAQFSSLNDLAIPYDFIVWGSTGLVILLCLVAFIVDIVTGKRVKGEEKPEETAPEAEEEAKPVYEEIKTEEDIPAPAKEEVEPAIVPPTEEQLEFERREEEASSDMEDEPKEKKPKKPANKKPTEKKPTASKKPTETKPAKKPANKKPSKEEEEDDDSDNPRVYHVSRRPELNKWQVKMAGSDKAIKLFNTQKEAIDYAEQLAESQGGSVRVHGVNGKIRKHRS